MAAKGVTGKTWRVIDQMYAHASSRTQLGGVLSELFLIERGVAQGCLLSPSLYAVFVDSLLHAGGRTRSL